MWLKAKKVHGAHIVNNNIKLYHIAEVDIVVSIFETTKESATVRSNAEARRASPIVMNAVRGRDGEDQFSLPACFEWTNQYLIRTLSMFFLWSYVRCHMSPYLFRLFVSMHFFANSQPELPVTCDTLCRQWMHILRLATIASICASALHHWRDRQVTIY